MSRGRGRHYRGALTGPRDESSRRCCRRGPPARCRRTMRAGADRPEKTCQQGDPSPLTDPRRRREPRSRRGDPRCRPSGLTYRETERGRSLPRRQSPLDPASRSGRLDERSRPPPRTAGAGGSAAVVCPPRSPSECSSLQKTTVEEVVRAGRPLGAGPAIPERAIAARCLPHSAGSTYRGGTSANRLLGSESLSGCLGLGDLTC